MHFSRTTKYLCVGLLSFSLSNAPAVAVAATNDLKLIPTTEVVEEISRAQKENKVQEFLSRTDVQGQLIDQGVSPDEAAKRVAHLSEAELNQLSYQVEKAHAGGNILVAVLLVVLIIFLVKRI